MRMRSIALDISKTRDNLIDEPKMMICDVSPVCDMLRQERFFLEFLATKFTFEPDEGNRIVNRIVN